MNRQISGKKGGFTLIELMVAIAVGSFALAAIVGFFFSQQRSAVTQQAVLDMQQSMRAGMVLMEKDLRMAGFDPTRNANAGINVASANTIEITADLDGDGSIANGARADQKETVRYTLNVAGNGLIRDALDGTVDEIIPNVDAIEFTFFDDNGNQLNDDGAGAVTTNIGNIRTIQVAMVARSGASLPGLFFRYTDNTTYQNRQGTDLTFLNGLSNPPADNFRRIILYSSVDLRNIGLPPEGRQS